MELVDRDGTVTWADATHCVVRLDHPGWRPGIDGRAVQVREVRESPDNLIALWMASDDDAALSAEQPGLQATEQAPPDPPDAGQGCSGHAPVNLVYESRPGSPNIAICDRCGQPYRVGEKRVDQRQRKLGIEGRPPRRGGGLLELP